MKNAPNLFAHPIFKNLLGAATLWLVAAVGLCYWHGETRLSAEIEWTFGIWTLCTLGLIALGKLLAGIFRIATGPDENRLSNLVQTSVWILIKLACFLILNAILVKSASVPRFAILLGLGTLGVVPLLSGISWSWFGVDSGTDANVDAEVFRHA